MYRFTPRQYFFFIDTNLGAGSAERPMAPDGTKPGGRGGKGTAR